MTERDATLEYAATLEVWVFAVSYEEADRTVADLAGILIADDRVIQVEAGLTEEV